VKTEPIHKLSTGRGDMNLIREDRHKEHRVRVGDDSHWESIPLTKQVRPRSRGLEHDPRIIDKTGNDSVVLLTYGRTRRRK